MNKEGEIQGLRHGAMMEYRLRTLTVLPLKVILNHMRAATITVIDGLKYLRIKNLSFFTSSP